MTLFWKAIGGALTAAILGLCIGKETKGITQLLGLAACSMCAFALISFLEPLITLIQELEELAKLENDFLSILLKTAGISLICEFAGQFCQDSGNSALGKTVFLLGNAVILYLSVPVIRILITRIQELTGG